MTSQAKILPDTAVPAAIEATASRGALVRRLLIFQIKLFADGIRDLVLSPISFVVAGVGILFGGRNPHGLFDRLMHAGHKTDGWIDLFGHHDRAGSDFCLEQMIDDVETALRNDHARGGLTAEAEKRMRSLLAELYRRSSDRKGFRE